MAPYFSPPFGSGDRQMEIETTWATATNPLADIPLYWLVNRDPHNDSQKSLYNWVV